MFLLRRALFALAISMAVPVCAAQAATITVDRTDDADISACSDAANDCTLRGAINKANATAGADTIQFALNNYSVLYLTQSSLPTINGELTIQGLGPGLLTLGAGQSAAQNGPYFTVPAGSTLNLNGISISGGADRADGNRGGVIDNAGTTRVKDCRLSSNFANGGALYNSGSLTLINDLLDASGQFGLGGPVVRNTANLTVTGCMFDGNQSISRGAGIDNTGTANVAGSAFVGNSAGGDGGAIYNGGTLNVTNSTFSDNQFKVGLRGARGAAIYSGDGGLVMDSCTLSKNTADAGSTGGLFCKSNGTVRNSIISNNIGDDVGTSGGTTPLRSLGANLIGTGTGAARFTAAKDQVGITDPKLGGPGDNGGPGNGSLFGTLTYELLPGSPAIDKGDTDLMVDQRNSLRPQGAADDIGAFEKRDKTPEQPSLVVNEGGFVIDDTDDRTTLPEAILYANSKPGADTITFLPEASLFASTGIPLPDITDDVTIQGLGANQIGYGGFRKVRPLHIVKGVTATISGLQIFGGSDTAADGRGGGILNEGNLTLRDMVIVGNTGTEGGGISNIEGSLTLIRCQISNNTARNSGGGIFNANGSVSITNSTVSGNIAEGSAADASGGAGIDSFGAKASVSLDAVTLTGNSAPNVAGGNRAGVWLEEGALTIHNSILSGNGTRDLQNDAGTLTSSGYNIIGALSARAGLATSDRVGVDPQLGDLANNGGPTLTRALLTGSPAINTGDPIVQNGFDQRGDGFARVRGGIVDVGAFEVQSDAAMPIVSLSPQNPTTGATLTATASGFDAGAIYSYVWKNNDVVIASETSNTLDLSKPGNGDVGDVITVEVTSGSVVRTASVQVINRAPFAYSRNVSATAGVEASFELRGSDPDGDAITFAITKAPTNGTAEIKVDPIDGKIKLFYKSRARFNGVDVIRFVAIDTSGAKSQEATLGIAVKYSAPPVNRAPIAGDTNIDTYVGDSVVKGLLGSDPDGDPITFRIVNNAKYGSSEIKRDTDGNFKLFYTSLNRFYGNDRVTYIAIDDKGKESNVATININFINRAPSAQNNNLTVASGELVSQYLFGTDADNDALTFRLVNNPQYGTGSVKRDEQGNWRVYYQSVPNYVGADRITFIAIDPKGKEWQVATASINVVRVGPAPSASGALQTRKAPSNGNS